MIAHYFDLLKGHISLFEHLIEFVTTDEKTFGSEKGYLKGRIYFVDKSVLEFLEVKDTEKKNKVKYRYHYMSKCNELVFR
jgi:hypothetical protein